MSQTKATAESDYLRQRDFDTQIVRLYHRHAHIIFSRFGEWKGRDEFYFIPLALNMLYCGPGFGARLADPPYHLGTIVRNSIENPALFGCRCPNGHQAYAVEYNGSPLSGRFDMSVVCPVCGNEQHVTESGWRVRSEALKATRKKDALRAALTRRPWFKAADLRDLLRFLGIPEEDLELAPLEHKIEKTVFGNGDVLLQDRDGGFCIIRGDSVESHGLIPRPEDLRSLTGQ